MPAGWVLEAALRLGGARTAVPAVDAHTSRPVADVEATTAVAVRVARVAETHVIGKSHPRVSPADAQYNQTTMYGPDGRPTRHDMRNTLALLWFRRSNITGRLFIQISYW